MLNMFTFDVLSVCHSLSQPVMVIALFIFWLITHEYNFSLKIYKMQNICMLNMFTFDVFSDCHSISDWVVSHGHSLVYILAYTSGKWLSTDLIRNKMFGLL